MKASIRTCVACRKKAEKWKLVRIALCNPKGPQDKPQELELCWDREQRLPGRGGYLHPGLECVRMVLVAQKWERVFRLPPGSLGSGSMARAYEDLAKEFSLVAQEVAPKKRLRL